MPTPVTASMLYDVVMCPHRVTKDLNYDPAQHRHIHLSGFLCLQFLKLLNQFTAVEELELHRLLAVATIEG